MNSTMNNYIIYFQCVSEVQTLETNQNTWYQKWRRKKVRWERIKNIFYFFLLFLKSQSGNRKSNKNHKPYNKSHKNWLQKKCFFIFTSHIYWSNLVESSCLLFSTVLLLFSHLATARAAHWRIIAKTAHWISQNFCSFFPPKNNPWNSWHSV